MSIRGVVILEFNIPEPSLDPPADKVLCYCGRCLGEIYDGESYGIDGNGKCVCIDCAENEFNGLTSDEKFIALSMEVRH